MFRLGSRDVTELLYLLLWHISRDHLSVIVLPKDSHKCTSPWQRNVSQFTNGLKANKLAAAHLKGLLHPTVKAFALIVRNNETSNFLRTSLRIKREVRSNFFARRLRRPTGGKRNSLAQSVARQPQKK
jgi:hypothetical protein